MTMTTLPQSPADRKRLRYSQAEYLRGVTSRSGGRKCMFALGSTMSAAATSGGLVHVGGVQRCGSVWACPVCSPTIRERRAGEIDTALGKHLADGGVAYFVTSTVRHSAGTPLAQVLGLVQESWRDAWRPRSIDKRGSGYLGAIRAIEITHGSNGWHPHIHAVVMFEPGTSAATAENMLRRVSVGWSYQLSRRGASCNARGFDFRPVHDSEGVSGYLAKVDGGWGAGLELARGDLKLQAGKGTTPFQFLERAANGCSYSEMMFLIYEQATSGRRQLVWSRGLKARFGIDDVSDVDAAEETLHALPVLLAIVPAGKWRQLLRTNRAVDMLTQLGELASTGDLSVWQFPPAWLQLP